MRHSLALLLIATLFAAAGCSSDAQQVQALDGPAVDTAPLVTHELGAGLLIQLNEAWSPGSDFEVATVTTDGDCNAKRLTIRGEPAVTLFLVGQACSSSSLARGNGERPLFSSATQLADAADRETIELVVGTLTLATVEYFECTNECVVYQPTVGVVELAAPADPDFPTLVIASDYERAGRDHMRRIALALAPAR